MKKSIVVLTSIFLFSAPLKGVADSFNDDENLSMKEAMSLEGEERIETINEILEDENGALTDEISVLDNSHTSPYIDYYDYSSDGET